MAPTSHSFAQIDEIIAAIERNRLRLNPAGLKILSIPSAMSSPGHLKKIRVSDRMAGGWQAEYGDVSRTSESWKGLFERGRPWWGAVSDTETRIVARISMRLLIDALVGCSLI